MNPKPKVTLLVPFRIAFAIVLAQFKLMVFNEFRSIKSSGLFRRKIIRTAAVTSSSELRSKIPSSSLDASSVYSAKAFKVSGSVEMWVYDSSPSCQ